MAEEDALELVQSCMRARRPGSAPSISHLGKNPVSEDLLPKIVSETSWDQEQSNPLFDAGEETIRSYVIEITRDMKKKFSSSKNVKIPTVPHNNRSLDKNAYAPQFVSFGPYHRGTEAVRSAEKYKWSFLYQILNMYKDKDKALKMYLEEMNRVEPEMKTWYDDIQNDGIKMLLFDGCCVLGFLGMLPPQQAEAQTQKQDKVVVAASTVWKCIPWVKNPPRKAASVLTRRMASCYLEKRLQPQRQGESKLTADSTIITLWHHNSIRHDLLLLENQLPFIVLKQIYDLATGRTDVSEPHPLIEKVDKTMTKLLKSYPLITNRQNFDHLLHCCHLKFKPAMANSSSSNSKPKNELERKWRGATELYKAGIKFKPKLSDPNSTEFSLLDVQLVSGRTLMIPTLKIEDSTNSVFRNLIAFEQSCTQENYFAAYAFFMGELMGTPEDVTLLINQGVVENYIGANKEVSDLFNNLVKGVIFDVDEEHFLRSTFKDLNSYYNNKGHKFLADLKQNYCGSPWLVISVLAAAVILVCTVVQTVFAVIK